MSPQSQLKKLFSPLELGELSLKNRIVSTAHSTGLNDGVRFGERLFAYYEALARGGVGLIITGSTTVHPTSVSKLKPAVANWDDTIIDQYLELASIVHSHGAKVFAQLNHAGVQSGVPAEGAHIIAPSPIDVELGFETPREMDEEIIAEIISSFADAAKRVKKGGLDGLELHGGHGNLIQQFLSPLTNRRNDRYGGDSKRRLQFALDVLRAVREAVGESFIIGLRISAQEDIQGGLTLQDTENFLPILVEAGRVNYVNVTSGSDYSAWSLSQHYAPMYVSNQHHRKFAAAIRKVIDVPILVAGRVTDPRDAEAILTAGDADLVGMTRALIADHDLPAKAKSQKLNDIRYCVGINQGCLGRLWHGKGISCVQDPTSGREKELGPLQKARQKRRVVVVGGGVAGLEAARAAAVRGHEVILLEKSTELGGQLRQARRAPGRAEIGAISDQLIRQIDRLNVDVRFGVDISIQSLKSLNPEVVIFATGSTPRLPDLDESEMRLVSAIDAFDGADVGENAIVFDTKGDMVGLTAADWLAKSGRKVTFVTTRPQLGLSSENMTVSIIHHRLASQNVEIVTDSKVTQFTDKGVVIENLVSMKKRELEGVVTVVAACGAYPNNDLFKQWRQNMPDAESYLVGDAASPRQIEQAIYEGHMSARSIA